MKKVMFLLVALFIGLVSVNAMTESELEAKLTNDVDRTVEKAITNLTIQENLLELDRLEAMDGCTLACQGRAEVVKYLRIDVLHEVRVEGAQLVERVELPNGARRVFPHDHRQFAHMLGVNVLPELAGGFRLVVDAVEDIAERMAVCAVPISVPKHDPGICTAEINAHNPVVLAFRSQAVLVGLAFLVDGGVVCIENVLLEGVFSKVIVG